MTKSHTEEVSLPTLLENAKKILEEKARLEPAYFSSLSPIEFENEVYSALVSASINTQFQNNIKLISGHAFPDIVIQEKYGIEVKSSKSNQWHTLGNSVLESTRIPSVESIYIFFGKLIDQAEFCYRKYEDCLEEVAVTHSPRYIISMDLPPDKSIFKKMGCDYDSLRTQENPIQNIISYYKRTLGSNATAWWLNSENDTNSSPFMLRFWNSLSQEEKSFYIGYIFFLFPEIFGSSSQKYNNISAWLAKKHSIIVPCLRDIFSAGGQASIRIRNTDYTVPKIYQIYQQHLTDFISARKNAKYSEVVEFLNHGCDFEDTIDNRKKLWTRHIQAILHQEWQINILQDN